MAISLWLWVLQKLNRDQTLKAHGIQHLGSVPTIAGEAIEITCKRGYRKNYENVVRCLAGRQTSPAELPTCNGMSVDTCSCDVCLFVSNVTTADEQIRCSVIQQCIVRAALLVWYMRAYSHTNSIQLQPCVCNHVYAFGPRARLSVSRRSRARPK